MASSSKSSPVALRSNLHRFIQSVTPTVPSRFVSKICIDDTTLLHTTTGEIVESFTLGDLWKVYDEWGAYGRGVPVMFNNGKVAVQYYVPFLSGIQLYTPTPLIRTIEGDVEDLWSIGSEGDAISRTSADSSNAWDGISFDSSSDEDAPWASEDSHGYLYFEYFDNISPYMRVPIVDKVLEFAPTFPGLFTLRSSDLAPASWMSVAWYPIQANGPNRPLSACFLSFHTLSAEFEDEDMYGGLPRRHGYISLTPFGLSTYKLEGGFWLNGANDCDNVLYLYSAADSWLRQLEVKQHHDFNFFAKHSPLEVCPLLSAP